MYDFSIFYILGNVNMFFIFLKFLISLNFQIHSFALYVLYKYSSPILCVQTIFLVFLTVGAFLAFLSDATLSPQCDLDNSDYGHTCKVSPPPSRRRERGA